MAAPNSCRLGSIRIWCVVYVSLFISANVLFKFCFKQWLFQPLKPRPNVSLRSSRKKTKLISKTSVILCSMIVLISHPSLSIPYLDPLQMIDTNDNWVHESKRYETTHRCTQQNLKLCVESVWTFFLAFLCCDLLLEKTVICFLKKHISFLEKN